MALALCNPTTSPADDPKGGSLEVVSAPLPLEVVSTRSPGRPVKEKRERGPRGCRGVQSGAGQVSAAASGSTPGAEDPKSPGVDEGGEGPEGTNAVSLLQEYIQGCASFSPHAKILSWSFEQQLYHDTSLQFRATVSFAYGDVGVPHHFCGGWQTSKKKSQRDTAERVRRYLVQRFERETEADAVPRAAIDPETVPADVLQALESVHGSSSCASEQTNIAWKVEDRSSPSSHRQEFRATLSFVIKVVPHSFAGAWCENPDEACADTTERVLWYLGKVSNVTFTERAGDPSTAGKSPRLLTPPPAALPGIGSVAAAAAASSEDQQAVENKTILMQVQNALQKTFSKDTPPGERVWVWSYETGEMDSQLFRAHVEVPAWQQKFTGDWCRGKKLAQRNACLMVKARLDHRMAAR